MVREMLVSLRSSVVVRDAGLLTNPTSSHSCSSTCQLLAVEITIPNLHLFVRPLNILQEWNDNIHASLKNRPQNGRYHCRTEDKIRSIPRTIHCLSNIHARTIHHIPPRTGQQWREIRRRTPRIQNSIWEDPPGAFPRHEIHLPDSKETKSKSIQSSCDQSVV